MSNIYIQEPPTNGKVLLKTTAGDIDIELWSKEAPKACRNFIQLCLEAYYDNTIFHRVVPGFIVQGGDPTGTGTGGESIYGAPFKDEFHSRLRFNRRGLVAMANAGPHDNGSQFFFTLGRADELNNKHTIFGKVTGDTVYNMLRLTEVDIDEEVNRVSQSMKGRSKSSHDLLKDDPHLSSVPAVESEKDDATGDLEDDGEDDSAERDEYMEDDEKNLMRERIAKRLKKDASASVKSAGDGEKKPASRSEELRKEARQLKRELLAAKQKKETAIKVEEGREARSSTHVLEASA